MIGRLKAVGVRLQRRREPRLMEGPSFVPPFDLSLDPLFDAAYYLAQRPDVAAAGVDPLTHFLSSGGSEGSSPHPLFDARYYLKQRPDVAAAGVNPLVHFLTDGYAEGVRPHPLFDPEFYRQSTPELAAFSGNLLIHFLQNDGKVGCDPHPLFSIEAYLRARPERPLPGNPLVEYVSDPDCSEVDTHPLFDAAYYLAQRPDAAAAGVNPLMHFLRFGWMEGSNPHPLFDTRYYLRQRPDVAAAGLNPLLHFLALGYAESVRPHPLFDPGFYRRSMPELAAVSGNPLIHFLQNDWKIGCDPHPLFSIEAYLRARPERPLRGNPLVEYVSDPDCFEVDVHPLFSPRLYRLRYLAGAGESINPLAHYLGQGCDEGCRPNDWFDPKAYPRKAPVDGDELAHFVSVGRRMGWAPTPQGAHGSVFYRLMCEALSRGDDARALLQDRALTRAHLFDDVVSVAGEVLPVAGASASVTTLRPVRPHVVPKVRLQSASDLPSADTELPACEVAMLEQVLCVGGSRLIVTADRKILHDEYHRVGGRDSVGKLPFMRAQAGERVLGHIVLDPERIESGVLLSSDADYNYFHWMVEALPKLEFIEAAGVPSDVPLLISDKVPSTGVEALRRVANGRAIKRLREHFGYRVERLYVPADRSWVLNNYEHPVEAGGDIVIDPEAIAFLRAKLLDGQHEQPKRRVLLVRKPGFRDLVNQAELSAALSDLGFEAVDTGGMTLDEQISLWSDAEMVVAPTGAALTNIAFANVATRILIMAPAHPQTNPYLFTQMAAAVGADATFTMGARAYALTSLESLHDDFAVDIDSVVAWVAGGGLDLAGSRNDGMIRA